MQAGCPSTRDRVCVRQAHDAACSHFIEGHVAGHPFLGITDGVVSMEIDLFIFEAPPQPFHEDVIPPPARPIHTDLNPLILEKSSELLAGELTALIRIEDLRGAIPADRLPHGLQTEVCGQRVGQPPGQHPTAGLVQNSEQKEDPTPQGNKGLRFKSKCNTTSPEGLKCCYANETLHAREC